MVLINIRTGTKVTVEAETSQVVCFEAKPNRTPNHLTAVWNTKNTSRVNTNIFVSTAIHQITGYSVKAKLLYHDFKVSETDAAAGPSRFRLSWKSSRPSETPSWTQLRKHRTAKYFLAIKRKTGYVGEFAVHYFSTLHSCTRGDLRSHPLNLLQQKIHLPLEPSADAGADPEVCGFCKRRLVTRNSKRTRNEN